MDRSERLAFEYLRSLDLGCIEYEPDGNIPPDFLLGGRIAVEVRRLNQHFFHSDRRPRGLEEESISLLHRLQKLLGDFGPPIDGECWWIGLSYGRPIGKLSRLVEQVRRALEDFRSSDRREDCELRIGRRVSVRLRRSDVELEHYFTLATRIDTDAGGFVVAELIRNLQFCVDEKLRKIEPFRSRYSEWWLVLPDHIDWAVDLGEREDFVQRYMPRIKHGFDRIVLLDPRRQHPPFVVTPVPNE